MLHLRRSPYHSFPSFPFVPLTVPRSPHYRPSFPPPSLSLTIPCSPTNPLFLSIPRSHAAPRSPAVPHHCPSCSSSDLLSPSSNWLSYLATHSYPDSKLIDRCALMFPGRASPDIDGALLCRPAACSADPLRRRCREIPLVDEASGPEYEAETRWRERRRSMPPVVPTLETRFALELAVPPMLDRRSLLLAR